MISALGKKLNAFSTRWVPDPFVFALLLTFLALVLGYFFGSSVQEVGKVERFLILGNGWYDSFTSAGLLKFAFQMCFVLITGHAIAMSGPVKFIIRKLVTIAKTPRHAVVLVSFIACSASLIQWGLGAIVGAFAAREVGRAFEESGRPIHYPLLGAAGYAGFLVWHGGLSGSAPLKVAEAGHFLEHVTGVISVDQTIFSSLNITVIVVLLVLVPAFFALLMPTDENEMVGIRSINQVAADGGSKLEPHELDLNTSSGQSPIVSFLESHWFLNRSAGVFIFGFVGYLFLLQGVKAWNLDSINLLFLGVAFFVHRSPTSVVRAIADGAKGCGGILLQFPLYFGILGLMKSSGLLTQWATWFAEISTVETLPVVTFISAGLINFLVPSGGGQWAVQGPVVMQAASDLGANKAAVVMALAYGDAWTNMLQPFWALPLLGIMGLRARDIVGYTGLLMLVAGPVVMVLLYVMA